ncbi:MAG: divalent metal cation transporter [bacterium]|nr:divalent metal cation transporter [bacterium]
MHDQRTSPLSGVLKAIGPGILFAGAAIGGSHLVQSTRAGAVYGFALVWAVVLANFFKYPFFEFAYRYSGATGETMLVGYRRVGKWTLWCFLAIAFVSGIVNLAAVTMVTAGLAGRLISVESIGFIPLNMFTWTLLVVAVCTAILAFGRYAVLDGTVKVIMIVLAISTVSAFFVAAVHGGNAAPDFQRPSVWNAAGIVFLLGLMGWMPAPIDGSVWPTLWAVQRRKQTGHTATFRETLIDFNVGFIGTAILALFFLGLGALVMYGTGETFPKGGIGFAGELFELYTDTLGSWSFYLVATAAFTCMFSTTLTCFDAYTRTIHSCLLLARDASQERAGREDWFHWSIMGFFVVTTLAIIGWFAETMVHMLTTATVMAFILAPMLAFLNYRVVTDKHMPAEHRPKFWLHLYAWAGMLFLAGFTVLFLWTKLR